MTTVGVGIDLVDVDRFEKALARRPSLAARIFTEGERRDARGRPERLAGRFAAKEATWKSLGVGLGALGLHEVEVVKLRSGKPEVRLHGKAVQLASTRGANVFHLSITHTERSAGAVVIAESA